MALPKWVEDLIAEEVEKWETIVRANPAREPYPAQRRPHVCPICGGKGLVMNGFYRAIGVDSWSTEGSELETCRSCAGRGIVWELTP